MKITFVFDGLQFGGIERVGVEYVNLLCSRNHEITVLNLRPSLNAMERELPAGVTFLRIPFPRSIAPQRYSKLLRTNLCGRVAFCFIFTVVNLVQKLYKLLYLNRIPDADIAIAFSGHYNDLTVVSENFSKAKKIAWLHGNQNSYDEIAPGYFKLYDKIKNLICLSEVDDEKCTRFNMEHGIHKKRIYNPITIGKKEVNKEKVEKLRRTYGDFVLMIGRMAKDKDQATLIRAMGYLKSKYGIYKKLVLVGDGPERAYLEKMVRELSIDEEVFFEGMQSDVQNYYSAAGVFVHSSPAEGLPTVLLEAMYFELPIAATNSLPGVPEVLCDNCGLITPVGDAEKLADSIYQLYTDNELIKRLRGNCQERLKNFLPKYVMMQFDEYIKELI